mgnify:CR=1 FL=1
MKQSITLPMADKFYHDQQDSAYIRSVNVSWEIPEENHYYLEYSYNRKDWYALNGGIFNHPSVRRTSCIRRISQSRSKRRKNCCLRSHFLYKINMGSQSQYVYNLSLKWTILPQPYR